MKIVHLNTYAESGGAAIAVNRINKSLSKLKEVKSKRLASFSVNRDKSDLIINNSFFRKFRFKIIRKINKIPLKRYKNDYPFSTGLFGIDISKNINVKNSDLINLHWVNHGFLGIKSLEKIFNLNKPVVWTLHDMWAFTGGCHVNNFCEKYKKHCFKCPVLKSGKEKDISYRLFERKKKIYGKTNLNVVVPSSWMAECVKKSKLFGKMNLKIIPNCLDTDIFKPVLRKKAIKYFDLPEDKKYILFGAFEPEKYLFKGYNLLIKLIKSLIEKKLHKERNIALLIFGMNFDEKINNLEIEKYFLGELSEGREMNLCYNAADIYLTTSYMESFGLTIIESMACETPVIAFDKTGPKDIIKHKENGYLAEYKSTDDLLNGLLWILKHNEEGNIGKRARTRVQQKYSLDNVGKEYLKLYDSLLKDN